MGLATAPSFPVEREAGSRAYGRSRLLLKSNKKRAILLLLELSGAKGPGQRFRRNRDKANHPERIVSAQGIGAARAARASAHEETRRRLVLILKWRLPGPLVGDRSRIPRTWTCRRVDLSSITMPKHYKD